MLFLNHFHRGFFNLADFNITTVNLWGRVSVPSEVTPLRDRCTHSSCWADKRLPAGQKDEDNVQLFHNNADPLRWHDSYGSNGRYGQHALVWVLTAAGGSVMCVKERSKEFWSVLIKGFIDLKRNLSLLKLHWFDWTISLFFCVDIIENNRWSVWVNVFNAIVLKLEFKIQCNFLKCRQRK